MKNKKSQGMPLNTIIIAIVVLIVLVVLILIFTGRIKLWGQGLDDCSSKGAGAHGIDEDDKCEIGEAKVFLKEDSYCCVPIVT